jgi:beta-glucosidase
VKLNAQYLTVIMEGRYTDAYLKRLGADAPKFTDADLKAIGSPLDFVGLNVYNPTWVRADETKKSGSRWWRGRLRIRIC